MIIVLVVFDKLQRLREKYRQTRTYKISFRGNPLHESVIEQYIKSFQLTYWKKRNLKDGELFITTYDVIGAEKKLNTFNERLKADPAIQSYDY